MADQVDQLQKQDKNKKRQGWKSKGNGRTSPGRRLGKQTKMFDGKTMQNFGTSIGGIANATNKRGSWRISGRNRLNSARIFQLEIR